MQEHEQPSTPGALDLPPVGWREVLTCEHLPRLLVLCLAIWLHAANTMLAATTMPEAVGDIGGLRLISWAFALYLMGSIVAATAVSVYVGSAGLRRTMLVSTLVYTLGCVICAAAPAMPVLLVGRTVQGLGGGALVALVFIAQDRFFPNRLVPRIVACLSVVWTVSALSGPLVGGAFATAGLWRFAFWSFALQGLVLAVLVYPLLARARSDSALRARRIPLTRLAFVAGAILAISFAGAGGSPAAAAVLVLTGCTCLWLFVARDGAAPRCSRLLPSHATDFAHPVGCGMAMTFILGLCMMSFCVYGPILLIRLYELTPLEAGFVVVTESLGWCAGAFFLSGLGPAQERRVVRCGSVMLLTGIATQAWFMPHGPARAHRRLGVLRQRRLRHDVGLRHQARGRQCGSRGSGPGRIDAAEHAADRLRTRRCPERDYRQRAGLRSDDAARGLAHGGVLGVRRVRAAGIARNADCVALQRPDCGRSPPASTQAVRVGCFVVATVAHTDSYRPPNSGDRHSARALAFSVVLAPVAGGGESDDPSPPPIAASNLRSTPSQSQVTHRLRRSAAQANGT